jgi:hypothetical protein
MKKSDLIENIKEYQEFIQLNIKKAKKIAQKNISKSYLTGCTWIMINENESSTSVFYTFRSNDQLLITINGNVEKAKYEIIVDNNSLLIEKKDTLEHFNIINFQDDYLILNKLSTEEYSLFANQTKYKDAIKENVLKLLIEKDESTKVINHNNIELPKKKLKIDDYNDLRRFSIVLGLIAILAIIFQFLSYIYTDEKNYKNEEIEEVAPIVEEIKNSSNLNIENEKNSNIEFKTFTQGKFLFNGTLYFYEFKNNDMFESQFILSIYLNSTHKLVFTDNFFSTNAELRDVGIINNFLVYEFENGGGNSGEFWIYQNYLDLNDFKNYKLGYDCFISNLYDECFVNNINDFNKNIHLYKLMIQRLKPKKLECSNHSNEFKGSEDIEQKTINKNKIIHSSEYFDSIEG